MKIDNNMQGLLNQATSKQEASEVEGFANIFERLVAEGKEEELMEALEEFESIFVKNLMKNMHTEVMPGQGLFEKSHAREIFEDMLDEELAKEISKTGSIGIAKMMYDQLMPKDDEEHTPFDMKG